MASFDERRLFRSLTLPCGVTLKNRIVKSAMSDSLGDGRGGPTDAQRNLYALWANGGAAVSIIGEVQGTAEYPEKPGNLVLDDQADTDAFRQLTSAGQTNQALLWAQLGHAGAMADPQIGDAKGPSALSLPGLTCAALSLAEIEAYPAQCAATAQRAKDAGFGGVEIHAAHGFLLSQFLSPLFNHRTDAFGGSLENRMRLLLHVVDAVRSTVGPEFPVAIKLNATDQLEGGFGMEEALDVIAALDGKDVDVIDISGGTYFPGAPSASDRASAGPYFLDFAANARLRTSIPLMVTGGFKTQQQAAMAIEGGGADLIGLARALIVDPDLPHRWQADPDYNPQFPRFHNPPEGGVTAWYTMQMTKLATGQKDLSPEHLAEANEAYEKRDDDRRATWLQHFRRPNDAR